LFGSAPRNSTSNRQDGSGGDCLQAEGFTVQGDGEAVALLDQGEEFAVQPTRRTPGAVRAGVRHPWQAENHYKQVPVLAMSWRSRLQDGPYSKITPPRPLKQDPFWEW